MTDAASPREQELALWLWACDEAIAAGRVAPPRPPGLSDFPLGSDELACLRLLDGLRTRTVSDSSPEPDPTPTTQADEPDFLTVVRVSGLVDPVPLYEHTHRQAPDPYAPPETVAERMVAAGLLTRYQADRLLAGDRSLVLSGRYCILDRLGAGGMGEVFLCSHLVMKHKVAVKVLPPDRAADPTALERFRREARAVAALDHPNIVRAYDIDSDGPTHYLVMEYVEGRNLHDVVKADGPLDVRRAAGMVAQVAAALQHAHERGLVHRDIKPANLILDAAGTVKVLDLGLARFFQPDGRPADGDDGELVVGTADYMAPEQSFDSPSADTRADIYSLGCTLYYLLTGKAPFQEKSVARKLLCHQFRKPEPLKVVRPDLPAGLVAVVDRMTAKDPVDRYQTPAQVVAALRPWVGSTTTRRTRHHTLRAAAYTAVAAAIVTAAVYGPEFDSPEPERRVIETRPQSSSELEAVIARLRERNPRFDGKVGGFSYTTVENDRVIPPVRIEDGRVIELTLCTDELADVSPLAAMTTLQHLGLRGSEGKQGRLTDLSQLRGLSLKSFDCSSNPGVVDFSPLREMPLESLTFGGARVTDLTPLSGMPLKKVFGGGSKIADLSPLRGLRLTGLSVRGTQVSDLEPIRGMPLELFRCEGSRVRDLSPLTGAPLRVVSCGGAPIESLAPLADSPLVELDFEYKAKRDAGLRDLFGHVKRVNGKPAAQFWASIPKPNL